MGKEYGRNEVNSIQVLIFVPVCCCCFSDQYFSFFRGLSIISSVRYFFKEAYPFKNICQMEIFVIAYLLKECLVNKQFVSLCKVSKALRILKKPCLLNQMPFLHSYTRKIIMSSFSVRMLELHKKRLIQNKLIKSQKR